MSGWPDKARRPIAQGFLYVLTGNGDFDGMSLWGESFLKLQYTPASGGTAATLQVVDHWTPWTDLARTGQNEAQLPAENGRHERASEAIRAAGGRRDEHVLKNAKARGRR